MEENTTKILVMFLLGSFSMILGFIPMKLGKWFKNQDGSPRHRTILSSMLCYGGGVLFATTLIHMLPEVNNHLQNIAKPFIDYQERQKYICKKFVNCRSVKLFKKLIYCQKVIKIFHWLKSCLRSDFFSSTSSKNSFIHPVTRNSHATIMKNLSARN